MKAIARIKLWPESLNKVEFRLFENGFAAIGPGELDLDHFVARPPAEILLGQMLAHEGVAGADNGSVWRNPGLSSQGDSDPVALARFG